MAATSGEGEWPRVSELAGQGHADSQPAPPGCLPDASLRTCCCAGCWTMAAMPWGPRTLALLMTRCVVSGMVHGVAGNGTQPCPLKLNGNPNGCLQCCRAPGLSTETIGELKDSILEWPALRESVGSIAFLSTVLAPLYRYCVHCANVGAAPTTCIAPGGRNCTVEVKGQPTTTIVPCTAQPHGASAGTCFNTVNEAKLVYEDEPWVRAGVRLLGQRCPSCGLCLAAHLQQTRAGPGFQSCHA